MADTTTTGPFRRGAADFVQIGDQIFNRRHIVGLTNRGKRSVVVTTTAGDKQVDTPMSLAAADLGIGDFDETVL